MKENLQLGFSLSTAEVYIFSVMSSRRIGVIFNFCLLSVKSGLDRSTHWRQEAQGNGDLVNNTHQHSSMEANVFFPQFNVAMAMGSK